MMEELPYIESRINDLFKQFFSSCKVLLKRNCDVIQKWLSKSLQQIAKIVEMKSVILVYVLIDVNVHIINMKIIY